MGKTHCDESAVLHCFENVHKGGQKKLIKYNLIKINRSDSISILSKSLKDLRLVCSPLHLTKNMLEMFFMS